MSDTFARLAEVLEARKGAAADSSYVASLYHKGLNKILEKVGEESVETILAAKDAAVSGDPSDLIYETADLWFHSMIALAHFGLTPAEALKGATIYAARALGKEAEVGSLEPGKQADFVVLDAPDVNHWLYHFRPNAALLTAVGGVRRWSR